MSVYLSSVCLLAYLKTDMCRLHKIFWTCYLWLWLGPFLTTMLYTFEFVDDIMFSHNGVNRDTDHWHIIHSDLPIGTRGEVCFCWLPCLLCVRFADIAGCIWLATRRWSGVIFLGQLASPFCSCDVCSAAHLKKGWWQSLLSSLYMHCSHCNTNLCGIKTAEKESQKKLKQTRMWANAQRDGRPAKYRWRPLFNAAKFGWRPLLKCCAVTLPRRESHWNLQWCPKLANRSQPLVGRSSPYYEDMFRGYRCLTSFFPIVDTCLSCEDTARQSCVMVPKWQFFASCILSEPRAAHFRHAF